MAARKKGYRVTITDRGTKKKVMDFNVTPRKARKARKGKTSKPKAKAGLGGFNLKADWFDD